MYTASFLRKKSMKASLILGVSTLKLNRERNSFIDSCRIVLFVHPSTKSENNFIPLKKLLAKYFYA